MIFSSACLQQTKQSPVSAYCLFSLLLKYSAVVAAPYIDISGRWMMLFCLAFLQRTKHSSFFLSPEGVNPLYTSTPLFLPVCQLSVLVERFAVLCNAY